jgi:adenylate kinase
MKIILIGIQGSGKSTQGNLLSEKLKIPYLSAGHIFRGMAKEKTPLGRYIKEVMNAGFLIPDGKTVHIVSEYLKKPEYQNGYILDGFPRTIDQVEKFANGVSKVIYLKVSDKEALWRLSYRNGENGGEEREDETLAAIRRRIELFHKLTEPVLHHYAKKRILVEIDGEKEIKDIFKEILEKIK